MRTHPGHPHEFVSLVIDSINCVMFLAVWVALAVEVSSDHTPCSGHGNGRGVNIACRTLDGALALSVAAWILFTVGVWNSSIRFARRHS